MNELKTFIDYLKNMLKKFLSRVIIITIIFLFGCNREREDTKMASNVSPFRDQPNPSVKLVLAPIGNPQRDRIQVRMDVINDGNTPIGWDKEFCVFINWLLETNKENPIQLIDLSTLEPDKQTTSKARFIKIMPGEKFSKEFDLKKTFRRFIYGLGTFTSPKGNKYHLPTAYEQISRFDIPKSTASLRVRVEYSRGFGSFDGFNFYFKFDPKEVDLLSGKFQSQEITIQIE